MRHEEGATIETSEWEPAAERQRVPKQKTGKFHGIFPSSPRKIPLTFPGFMGCFDVDIAFVDVDLDKASKSMFCAIDTGLIE